jgi:hypothetical protein
MFAQGRSRDKSAVAPLRKGGSGALAGRGEAEELLPTHEREPVTFVRKRPVKTTEVHLVSAIPGQRPAKLNGGCEAASFPRSAFPKRSIGKCLEQAQELGQRLGLEIAAHPLVELERAAAFRRQITIDLRYEPAQDCITRRKACSRVTSWKSRPIARTSAAGTATRQGLSGFGSAKGGSPTARRRPAVTIL